MERWLQRDLRSDPDEAEHRGDPGDLIDAAAFVADLLHRPAWHTRAACRGQGVAAWFPNRGEALDPARAVCAGCAVRAECLADSLGRPSSGDAGVWAGTSARERRQLRRVSTAA